MKINTVARTKLGVYSCPSLRIAENQEQGKDRRRIFCPRLLKTNYFFFFLFLFLFLFLDFSFFYFFGFFLFYFFGFSSFSFFFCLPKLKNEVTSLVLAAASNSFHSSNHPLLGCLLNWAYDPQAANTFHFSSGLTSNGQFSSFFIWAYL